MCTEGFRFSRGLISKKVNRWGRMICLKRYWLGDGRYHKNYENIYEIVDHFDGVNTAIKNAKRRMADYDAGTGSPSRYDPGITVFQLVEELKKYLE